MQLHGDRFLIQQVFKPIANEYRISIPSDDDREGEPLLYVRQKKMKIKEDIRFRLAPDDGPHLFMIKAKSVFEFRGRHDVLDADDRVIGLLEKDFGRSLLRSHWHVRDPDGNELVEAHVFMIKSKSVFEFRGRHEVLDADGRVIGLLEKDFTRSLLRSHWHVRDAEGTELFESYEASWIIALVRRISDIGVDWLTLLGWLPFNFVLRRGEQEVGTYKRVLGKFRDRYVLELRPELGEADRRLVAAFAVGLDALQDR